MDDTVHNSQPTWADKGAEPMDSPEERVLFLEQKLFRLQSKNESMRAFGNDLLGEEVALKEHNLVLADMISNLNVILTNSRPLLQLTTIPKPLSSLPIVKQKIPDPPLFAGDRSKVRAWIMDMRLKYPVVSHRTSQDDLYQQFVLKAPVKD